jgi:hypothetical protein
MAVLDPKPKCTTDGYQVVQSNDGAVGFPHGVKEQTFTALRAPHGTVEEGFSLRQIEPF